MGGAATTLAIERGRLDNGTAGRERSAGVLRESAGLLGIRVWVLVFTRLYWSARGGGVKGHLFASPSLSQYGFARLLLRRLRSNFCRCLSA